MDNFKKQLLEVYKPFWKVLIAIFILTGLIQICSAIMPYIFGKIVDSISTGKSFSTIVWYGLLLFIVDDIISQILEVVKRKIEIYHFNSDVKRNISITSFNKIMGLSIGQHITENSGTKKSIISSGDKAVHDFIILILYRITPMALYIFIATLALIWMNSALGCIVLISVIIFTYLVIKINSILDDENKKRKEAQVEKEKVYDEILRNTPLIILNAKKNKASLKYFSYYDKWLSISKPFWMKFTKLDALNSVLTGFFVFIVLVLGAYMVSIDSFTSGEFITFWFWSANIYGRMSSSKDIMQTWLDTSASLKKYFEMMKIKPDITTPANAIILKKIKGEIEFKNVSFKYPSRSKNGIIKNSDNTICNINFKIMAGEKVAFVGRSGSGKSTLINLATRAFDPKSGQILIDGVNLKNIDLENYRKQLGVVEQDVSLFDETLDYNITFGVNGVNEKELQVNLDKAIKVSQISEFLPSLEEGLNTIVGEKGIKLSGGQKQRVGIARTLAKDPSILIFDEATSSLDAFTEIEIHKAMLEASRGRTTIFIAHRLSTIKNVDKIFFIDKGKIIGEGNHQELVKTCKEYKKLVDFQSL